MQVYKGKYVYNRTLVFLISLLFGTLGIDRLYLQDYSYAIIKFITLGGFGIWYFVDMIRIGLGEKIGNPDYYWACELTKTCLDENKIILKTIGFIMALVLVAMFLNSKYYNNTKDLITTSDDKKKY